MNTHSGLNIGRDVPNTSQNFSRVQNSQKLIICGGIVKVSCFLIDKERVRNPDQLNVLCPNHQLFQSVSSLKREAGILPELPEIHVQGEILQKDSVKSGNIITHSNLTVSVSKHCSFHFCRVREIVDINRDKHGFVIII